MGDIMFDPSPCFGQEINASQALQEGSDLVGAFWGFPVVFASSQPGENVPREMQPIPEVVREHQRGDLALIPVPSQALLPDLAQPEGSLDSGFLAVG